MVLEVARSSVFLVVSVAEFPLLRLVVSSFSFLSSIGSSFSLNESGVTAGNG